MIVGLSPIRISFAGGGTDLPEFYNKSGGKVVTTAIDLFTYSIIHPRHDGKFQAFSPDFQKHYKPASFEKIRIEDGTEIASAVTKFLNYKSGINVILASDAPAGSGLGASSSLAVNLVNTIQTLKGKKFQSAKIAETAFKIGRQSLKWPIGKQDEYISAFGGFNLITFKKNKVTVSKIKIKKSTFEELKKNIMLFFVGHTRTSSSILVDQISRIKNNDKKTLDSLSKVQDLAESMAYLLNRSDITSFGKLLHEGWIAKRKFAKGVTNSRIDSIYSKAIKNGAMGGKLTGAGGGGHMIFYCEKQYQTKLIQSMKKYGLRHITFNFYNSGPKVLNLSELGPK